MEIAMVPAALPNSRAVISTAAIQELVRASLNIVAGSFASAAALKAGVRNPVRNAAKINARNACMRSFVIATMMKVTAIARIANGQ